MGSWEKMTIIGVAGRPGSGKSTVAQMLEEERGYIRLAFGGHLKRTAQLVYGLYGDEERHLYGTQADKEEIIPRLGVSGRFILERLGTEVCRSIHPDTWILAVWERILQLGRDQDRSRFVIEDVRFQNEVEFVQSWGEVWRIVRGKPPFTTILRRFLPGLRDRTHIAERPDLLRGIDWDIQNNGTLEELREQVLRRVCTTTRE